MYQKMYNRRLCKSNQIETIIKRKRIISIVHARTRKTFKFEYIPSVSYKFLIGAAIKFFKAKVNENTLLMIYYRDTEDSIIFISDDNQLKNAVNYLISKGYPLKLFFDVSTFEPQKRANIKKIQKEKNENFDTSKKTAKILEKIRSQRLNTEEQVFSKLTKSSDDYKKDNIILCEENPQYEYTEPDINNFRVIKNDVISRLNNEITLLKSEVSELKARNSFVHENIRYDTEDSKTSKNLQYSMDLNDTYRRNSNSLHEIINNIKDSNRQIIETSMKNIENLVKNEIKNNSNQMEKNLKKAIVDGSSRNLQSSKNMENKFDFLENEFQKLFDLLKTQNDLISNLQNEAKNNNKIKKSEEKNIKITDAYKKINPQTLANRIEKPESTFNKSYKNISPNKKIKDIINISGNMLDSDSINNNTLNTEGSSYRQKTVKINENFINKSDMNNILKNYAQRAMESKNKNIENSSNNYIKIISHQEVPKISSAKKQKTYTINKKSNEQSEFKNLNNYQQRFIPYNNKDFIINKNRNVQFDRVMYKKSIPGYKREFQSINEAY